MRAVASRTVPSQVAVVRALRASTKSTLICVLQHGGAVALGTAAEDCDAIVDLWVPGQMGGAALADVLFGDYSPAGRAPYTFYEKTADLQDMGRFDEYPEAGVSNGATYRHFTGTPLFRFGDGLSYTTFSYAWVRRPPQQIGFCDVVSFAVNVTNTGAAVSDEVVQVYVQTPDSTVPSPRIRLAAFDRVADFQPGETRTVAFELAPETHAVVYPDAKSVYVERRAVEAGLLVVHVGGSQPGASTLVGGAQPEGSTLRANVAVVTTDALYGHAKSRDTASSAPLHRCGERGQPHTRASMLEDQ